MATTIFPDLTDDLRSFVDRGLILDPWLAGLTEEHFEFRGQDMIRHAAEAIAGEYWREPLISQTLGAFPAPRRLGRTAVHEIITSTAAAIAHEREGRIHVSADVAGEAIARAQRFIGERGFGRLVWIYGAVTLAENHLAVSHYGKIAEDDFVRGTLHRPWIRYSLEDELLAGLSLRTYGLEVHDSRRCVVQTAEGERIFREIRRMMEDSGYLEQRLRLIYLSQFNLFENWDKNVERLLPDATAQRLAFTTFVNVPADARVLECGCGMATQTFEGGLWKAVGHAGSVVGLDPAPGMVKRARVKAEHLGARNVDFVLARAEAIPFEDDEFDAAVGAAFLHFTDAPQALREMCRVTRPGGTVAVFAGCRFSFDADWFREWFAPIFDLVEGHGTRVHHLLHEPGEVPRLFSQVGLQDVTVHSYDARWVFVDADVAVHHLVQGVSFFQSEMELLPWAARQELLEELRRRGEAVCGRTKAEERTLLMPVEFVRGIVPPG